MLKKDELKQQILDLTREYYREVHGQKKEFKSGETFVNYGGRYYDDEEMVNLVDSSLDFWLTAGPWAHKFETRLAKWLGVKYCAVCNSGSSANLLAFYALTSPKLGERAIQRGDEVITVAAGFPTTVNPIIQFGAIPVFVDVALPGFDIDVKHGRLNRLREQRTAPDSPNADFEYECDKHGNPYGWGLARYVAPETFYGDRVLSAACTPDDSFNKMFEHLRRLLPEADELSLKKLLL